MGLESEYYRLRAQFIDMTECRDALQQALEIVKAERDEAQKALERERDVPLCANHATEWFTMRNTYQPKSGCIFCDAEATIREQAERIKELEETLALVQSLSSQIWDAAEVAWKEEKTETEEGMSDNPTPRITCPKGHDSVRYDHTEQRGQSVWRCDMCEGEDRVFIVGEVEPPAPRISEEEIQRVSKHIARYVANNPREWTTSCIAAILSTLSEEKKA